MNIIKEGTYTQKQLFEVLGISKYTWAKRREDWLDHFADFCDYDMYQKKNGPWYFNIKEVYQEEYYPLPRKSNKAEKEADYEAFTLKHIEKNPYCSTAIIARNAIEDEEIQNKYHHKEGSAYRYIRPVVNNESKVHKGERVWGHLSKDGLTFILLTPQQLDYLNATFDYYFKDVNNIDEKQADIIAKEEGRDITKEEAKELIYEKAKCAYGQAMDRFREMWHFRPYKVSRLDLVAFDSAEEEAAAIRNM